MGKGDKKTKRGKIVNKSYGVRRMRKKSSGYTPVPKAEPVVEETPAQVKKAPAKKAAAKKTAAKTTTAKKTADKKTVAKKAPAKKTTAKKTTDKAG